METFVCIESFLPAIYFSAGADVSSEEQSVEELSQLREVRAADPGKGKGKSKDKGLKKKDKKKRKGKTLKKSDKKDAGKNSAKKNIRDKKKKNQNGLKRRSCRVFYRKRQEGAREECKEGKVG